MNKPETAEPPRPRKKSRSPYFGIRIMSATLGLLAVIGAAGTIFLMFEHNPQGESCAYVEPGEPYHLVLENGPCRITSTAVVEIIVVVVLLLGASQFLPLIFWAVTAYQIRLMKNPDMPDPAESRGGSGDFDALIGRLRDGESAPTARERDINPES